MPPKKISTFICSTMRGKLHPDRKSLDEAYRAACKERWRNEVVDDWKETESQGWPT